jgi:TrmH family RNA methyltransferase
MAILTSRSNPRIKEIRALRQRKARDDRGLFLVEGIRHVGEAVEAGAEIETICFAPDQLTSSFARQLVEAQQAVGVTCLELSPEVFASLAEKDNPVGILAVVRQPRHVLDQLSPATFPWGVALVAPQDPGNIGAVLRTVDAVGASGLLLLDGGADPFHPGAVRASMGALFWYPLVQDSFSAFATWARRQGYTLYGTSAHGTADYRDPDIYRQPGILVLGSERQGLSAEQVEACDVLLRIPMQGKVTSLNLGVAAGVMLYAMHEAYQNKV